MRSTSTKTDGSTLNSPTSLSNSAVANVSSSDPDSSTMSKERVELNQLSNPQDLDKKSRQSTSQKLKLELSPEEDEERKKRMEKWHEKIDESRQIKEEVKRREIIEILEEMNRGFEKERVVMKYQKPMQDYLLKDEDEKQSDSNGANCPSPRQRRGARARNPPTVSGLRLWTSQGA